jgi:fumarate hydratase subunit alpha
MREINAGSVVPPLSNLIKNCLVNVEDGARTLVERAAETETAPLCRWALQKIAENNSIAKADNAFACQDCGQAVLFVRVGQDLHIAGSLSDALNAGVAAGYEFARKSVADPLTRGNTGTNTPAVIHYEIVSGDALEIRYLAKGAGAENMSRVYMLTPSDGEKGIINSIVECVREAGANPCPPLIIGVGIGGTMEKCALLSKFALTRDTGTPNANPDIAALEEKILTAVNGTGVGAQGFGGNITALAVAVETHATHIGMLPVAVNLQCHSVRHNTLIL